MGSFDSWAESLCHVQFPDFTGLRIMMMPFRLDDLGTIPAFCAQYRGMIGFMLMHKPACGVGYLTVDEAVVPAGEFHRRPGLHVDGAGGWSANPGPWGGPEGMLVAASHYGCDVWHQTFVGEPGSDGNCEHLREQCGTPWMMSGGVAWWLGPKTVHESVTVPYEQPRQFVRVSMPSMAPWYEGYTVNPLGVLPTGPIMPRRSAQMGWRP